jgi:hypothetical protein
MCLAGWPGTKSGPEGRAWANDQAHGLSRHDLFSPYIRAGPLDDEPCFLGPVPGRAGPACWPSIVRERWNEILRIKFYLYIEINKESYIEKSTVGYSSI